MDNGISSVEYRELVEALFYKIFQHERDRVHYDGGHISMFYKNLAILINGLAKVSII